MYIIVFNDPKDYLLVWEHFLFLSHLYTVSNISGYW